MQALLSSLEISRLSHGKLLVAVLAASDLVHPRRTGSRAGR